MIPQQFRLYLQSFLEPSLSLVGVISRISTGERNVRVTNPLQQRSSPGVLAKLSFVNWQSFVFPDLDWSQIVVAIPIGIWKKKEDEKLFSLFHFFRKIKLSCHNLYPSSVAEALIPLLSCENRSPIPRGEGGIPREKRVVFRHLHWGEKLLPRWQKQLPAILDAVWPLLFS